MLIYKINFSLLTLFSLLIYIFGGRGLKGRAECRQTEVQTKRQTDKQTDDLSRLRQRIGEQTKSRTYAKNWRTEDCQGTGSINYIDGLVDIRRVPSLTLM